MPTPLEEGEKTLEAINNVSAQKVAILIASGSRMGAACARELA
jgi:soluble P-type ATPase